MFINLVSKNVLGLYSFKEHFITILYSEGAYYRREICVSKSAGLIIGGKFVSAIFQCANDNIGALTRNLWQRNPSEHANFKHNSNKPY